MRNMLKYTLLLLISVLTLPLSGQTYTFRGLAMAEGLSDLLVNVIYKDSTGFIWLGTDNCLDRFDGVVIKHYSFRGADIKRKRVTAVTETVDGQLWVGNGMGLWRLNRNKDELEQIATETIDYPVLSLLSDGKQTLYIGTEKGLFIHKDGQLKQVMTDNNVFAPANRIMGMNIDNSGIVWLATQQGLYAYNPQNEKVQEFHSSINNSTFDEFGSIARIDQTLYLGTPSQGIICFNIATHQFSRFVDVGCAIISSISTDGKEHVYVSTDGNGVHFLSHHEKRILKSFRHDARDKESIRSNSVYSLLVDRDGIIWIGFYQAGFDYSLYQNNLFHVYSFLPGFDSMNLPVRSFFVHDKEKLIGTRDGLYYINEEKNLVKSFIKPTLRSDLILSICYYEGEFYIGTYGGGLSILNPSTLAIRNFGISDAFVFQKGHIFCFEQDAKGNLWMGTSSGAFRYDGKQKKIQNYTNSNSQMPEGNVYEIYFDSSRKGWICTENGLCVYDPASGSMKSTIFPEGFIHKEKVRTVYEDSKHNLYFLPDKGSMLTSNLSMSSFYRTPINPALHGNAYMSVVEDNSGWLWFGCDNGIFRSMEGGENYYTYNFSDGVPSPTFTNDAAFKDSNGILWFGNAKGLLSINPEEADHVCRHPYRIMITNLLVNGKRLDNEKRKELLASDRLSLKKGQNNLTFGFANLSYSDPATMFYEYMLEGRDKEWKLLTGQNEMSYYDLPLGKYAFKVRIPGNEKSEIAVNIRIRPSFANLWIYLLIALTVATIVARVWTQQKKSENDQLPPLASRMAVEINNPLSASEKKTSEKSVEEKYKTNRLGDHECKVLYDKLLTYIENERPYTNPDLKIADLAKAIGTSSPSLSYVFNQYLNQPYYDFINEYRIIEFKKLANDSQYSRYTLSALAELCGFSSRASFFRSFKKSTGITPNEYIRSIGADNE